MTSLDSVSLAILLGAVLVMAGILSSLLALRFGAPLLLVFLVIGVLAGDAGPGGLEFSDVRTTYLVGSVALALITSSKDAFPFCDRYSTNHSSSGCTRAR